MMKKSEVIGILKFRKGDRPVADLATDIGVSASYLYDIFSGNREPGPKILSFLGLKRERKVVLTYVALPRRAKK